ncbi:M3 family oligoendopeptidase [Cohnella sp. CFH 77786]|uniref:M3 family oligoendopeptidase n=1 Tax=Cohnella sp. CFH 77786 TaxID=2662265 RepID=UPI001C608E51|nr:M3 family oligoendopeptidase [Cohnella sp. CFH 77786]MBW5447248.1 M3 family oligoendopeptidase [Cohnella sp. CFH 77786]
MKRDYSMVWDLDTFFPGGSASPVFTAFVEETERLTADLLRDLKENGNRDPDGGKLADWTSKLQQIQPRLREADSYVTCLTSQQVADRKAVAWTERVQTLSARYRQALDLYDALLAAMPEPVWQSRIGEPDLKPLSFVLNERREGTKDKLPPVLEGLASELAVDGYHGWSEHYGTIVSQIGIPWEEDGKTVMLSAGQAFNKREDADPAVRDRMMAEWEKAWAKQADLCADALNRLAGFRLKLYGLRGWNDVLKEPLRINRMSRATLDAMWTAVNDSIEPLKKYMSLKAGLIGKEKLDWQDVSAPLPSDQSKITYGEAALLIEEAFARFSPRLADLARRAFRERWIEAEDRPGKRPGGFCTDYPLERETRIFMTYSGTPGNVSTLAHELGHAYHGELVFGLPPFNQDYAMNVAETASTFAEGLVSDELLARAATDREKLVLLDGRLQSAVSFCMDIRARFLFETRFYGRRAKGMLEAAELNELMTEAQREAFGDALGSWHPHFWASKLHFYATDVPFYNFPYTFGYLFSTGLQEVAEKEGEIFRDRYDALLQDTGVMTVEDLASRHLGVKLDEPDFWRGAVARAVSDVVPFEELIRKLQTR